MDCGLGWVGALFAQRILLLLSSLSCELIRIRHVSWGQSETTSSGSRYEVGYGLSLFLLIAPDANPL